MIDLASIRHAAGVTQVQLAVALNTSQGQISRFEGQSDMLLSTLSSYLSALGTSARLTITVNGQILEQELTKSQRKA